MIHFDGIIFSWQKGGGVYRYFKELMKGLGEAGVPATLYLPKPHFGSPLPSNELFYITQVGIGPAHYPRFILAAKRKILSPLNSFLLGRRLSCLTSGVFHSTYFTTYEGLKIPQITTVHDMTYESFPEYFGSAGAKRHIAAKKASIDAADAIICVSEATKSALQARYPVANHRIHVIYHGVSETFNPRRDPVTDAALLAKYGISKPFILFVGKKGLYKNFSLLEKAFASWDKKGMYQLITVGDGGIVATDTELSALYGLAKAFVFPSLDEGFGLPILEALCSGGRVIASDIPVFREIGLGKPTFFDPKDVTSLIAALDVAHSLPTLSESERVANEREVRAKFSWDRTVNETLAVYRKLDPSV